MAQRARSRWAALVAVLAAAAVIGGVVAYSWAQTLAGQSEADQTAPAAVISQEGDSDGGRRDTNGNRRGNGQGRDIEPVDCDDARNHGEYVSSVARSTLGGPGKGAIVSEAARGDCGKPADGRGAEQPEADDAE
jgi:hypothetical protein